MTAASGVYPLHGGLLADSAPPAPRNADIVAELERNRESASAVGTTSWVSPPPPGVSTSLVMLCTLGCLLAVVLVVRGEALFRSWV